MCLWERVRVCSYRAKLPPFSCGVYSPDSISRLIGGLAEKIGCKLAWPLSGLAQYELEWSAEPECKFPPQPIFGIYSLCVQSSGGSKAPHFLCDGDGERKPAGSSGVKTSHWFSDVSLGQISRSCRRFIRQLIKDDRSMEGDCTVVSKTVESKIGETRINKAWLEFRESKALAYRWSIEIKWLTYHKRCSI